MEKFNIKSSCKTCKNIHKKNDIPVLKSNEFLLCDLNINEKAQIVGYTNFVDIKIKKRLLYLGLVCGTKISLQQVSVLKEVMLFEINSFLISMRKTVAQNIICRRVRD